MDNAQRSARGKSYAGLFVAVGGWSWFWGRGTPRALKKPEAPVQASREPVSREGAAQQKRMGLAGFIFWRKTRGGGEAGQRPILSVPDAVVHKIGEEMGQCSKQAAGKKWKAIRITAPGRYFLGFVRR